MGETLFVLFVIAVAVWKIVSWINYHSANKELETRIYSTQDQTMRTMEATGQTAASVWVYRMPSFIGKLETIPVFCDGNPIARLDNGSSALCKVLPGQHDFSLAASRTPARLTLEAGQEYFIRTSVVGLGKMACEAVSKQQGESEMSKL
jgi:hypothetical protein